MEPRVLVDAALAILDAGHRFRLALNHGAADTAGLTIEQVISLCRLELAEGPLTNTALALQLSRSENAITTLMKGLEERGLVSRRRDMVTDKRVVYRTITPEGYRALTQFRNHLAPMLQELTDGNNDDPLLDLIQSSAALRELIRLTRQQ